MSEKLNPCKRCGGEGKIYNWLYGDDIVRHWVQCSLCSAETVSYTTIEAAIFEWNEPTEEQRLRAELDAAKAEIERLRNALEDIVDANARGRTRGELSGIANRALEAK